MVNGLFNNIDASAGILENIYSQLNLRYEQTTQIENNPNSSKFYHSFSIEYYYEDLLTRFEHTLLPVLKSEFDKEIRIQEEYSNNFFYFQNHDDIKEDSE